ncbi:unnamed protein product, partial [Chrysoparadoxa australica]
MDGSEERLAALRERVQEGEVQRQAVLKEVEERREAAEGLERELGLVRREHALALEVRQEEVARERCKSEGLQVRLEEKAEVEAALTAELDKLRLRSDSDETKDGERVMALELERMAKQHALELKEKEELCRRHEDDLMRLRAEREDEREQQDEREQKLEKEREALAGELSRLSAEVEDVTARLAQAEAEAEAEGAGKDRVSQLEREIGLLQRERQLALAAEAEQVKKVTDELGTTRKVMQQLLLEKEGLQREALEMRRLKEGSAELPAEVEEQWRLKAEQEKVKCAELLVTVEGLEAEVAAAREEARQMRDLADERERLLEESKGEKKSLESELATVQSDLLDGREQTRMEESAWAQDRLKELRAEGKAKEELWRQEKELLQREHAVNVQEVIEKHSQEVMGLNTEVTGLRQRCAELTAEVDRLKALYTQACEARQSLEAKLEEVKTRAAAEMQQESEKLMRRASLEQEQLEKLHKTAQEEERAEVVALKGQVEVIEGEKTAMTEEKAALTAEKAALKGQVEVIEGEKKALTAEKSVLTEEKAALTEEKAALTEEKAALTEEKAALAAEKAALEQRIVELQARMEMEGELQGQSTSALKSSLLEQKQANNRLVEAHEASMRAAEVELAAADARYTAVCTALKEEVRTADEQHREKEAQLETAISTLKAEMLQAQAKAEGEKEEGGSALGDSLEAIQRLKCELSDALGGDQGQMQESVVLHSIVKKQDTIIQGLAQRETDCYRLKAALAEREGELLAARQKLASMEAEVAAAEQKLAEFKGMSQTEMQEVEGIAKEKSKKEVLRQQEQQEHQDQVMGQLEDLQQEMQDQARRISEQEVVIAQVESQRDLAVKELGGLGASELIEELPGVMSQRDQTGHALHALAQENQALEGAVVQLEQLRNKEGSSEKGAAATGQIQELQEKLSAHRDALKALQEVAELLRAAVKEKDEKLMEKREAEITSREEKARLRQRCEEAQERARRVHQKAHLLMDRIRSIVSHDQPGPADHAAGEGGGEDSDPFHDLEALVMRLKEENLVRKEQALSLTEQLDRVNSEATKLEATIQSKEEQIRNLQASASAGSVDKQERERLTRHITEQEEMIQTMRRELGNRDDKIGALGGTVAVQEKQLKKLRAMAGRSRASSPHRFPHERVGALSPEGPLAPPTSPVPDSLQSPMAGRAHETSPSAVPEAAGSNTKEAFHSGASPVAEAAGEVQNQKHRRVFSYDE